MMDWDQFAVVHKDARLNVEIYNSAGGYSYQKWMYGDELASRFHGYWDVPEDHLTLALAGATLYVTHDGRCTTETNAVGDPLW